MKLLNFASVAAAGMVSAISVFFGACSPAPVNMCPNGVCGTGATTGVGGGGQCLASQTSCNGACTDTTSDPANCGVCGTICGAGTVCSQSACAAGCAVGLTQCGQSCADTLSSTLHCGGCNQPCAGTCSNGVCQAGGGVGGTGAGGTGAGGTGGAGAGGSGVGGSGATGSGGSGGADGPLGGYHVSGDWAGFAFTFVDEAMTATISPTNFETMIDTDGPYCVQGTVAATEEYTSIAALGFNTAQPKISDAPVNTVASTGDGIFVDLEIKGGEEGIRIQIEDDTDPSAADAAEHRWCVNLTGTDRHEIPWETFNTQCWDGKGTPYDGRPIAKVILYVPDAGPDGATQNFDFCVNDIGPTNVQGRGEGEIVASCGNNVSWNGTSTNQQYQNFQTSDNKYQFQSNGWGWQGGGHSISLLPTAGFKMDSQTCSRNDASPCSFPSIYIGTDADGERTTGNLPKAISSITAIPTCLGWSSGGSPATDEYNVSYDVWFNSEPNATKAQEFLMLWFRDPPSFQPGGDFPKQEGVVIGGQTWAVWHGDNAEGDPVTSYAAPNYRADGQAYSFNLKDFMDDAIERGFLNPNLNLIAVMGGMEIWGGAQGASITGFRAEVQ